MKFTINNISRNLLFATLFTYFAFGLTSCKQAKPSNSATEGITKVVCDESFKNILDQEIDVFEYTYPKASIMPYYVSENAAIDSLINLKSDLIITSRKLSEKEQTYIEKKAGACYTQRIAVDAIALIVNKNNSIDSLSISELRSILEGTTATWNLHQNDSISIVFDNQGSSIVKYMRDSVLNGAKFSSRVFAQGSNPNVFKAIEKSKNAIGIIGVSWLSASMDGEEAEQLSTDEVMKDDTTSVAFNNRVKVLKIYKDGATKAFKPYQAYIYDGSYPLFRNIYATCAAPRGSLANGFFSFITGFIGQKIIMKTGILPSVIHPRVVSLN